LKNTKPYKIESFKNIPDDLKIWLNDINNSKKVLKEFGFTILSEDELKSIYHLELEDFEDESLFLATQNMLESIVFVAKNIKTN